MENLDNKLNDKEKIIYVIKELYENSKQEKDKEKFGKILIKLMDKNQK